MLRLMAVVAFNWVALFRFFWYISDWMGSEVYGEEHGKLYSVAIPLYTIGYCPTREDVLKNIRNLPTGILAYPVSHTQAFFMLKLFRFISQSCNWGFEGASLDSKDKKEWSEEASSGCNLDWSLLKSHVGDICCVGESLA
ncbi:hypothetical protein HN51_067165 [Arachis hypogaea]